MAYPTRHRANHDHEPTRPYAPTMTRGPAAAWCFLLALLAVTVGNGTPGVAAVATCVLAVAVVVVARRVGRPEVPAPVTAHRNGVRGPSSALLRQYAPARAGRPQPRAPGRGDCTAP